MSHVSSDLFNRVQVEKITLTKDPKETLVMLDQW